MCYLRDLADANRVVSLVQSCPGGNAVVIGGGYIGMECAASLVINRMSVTMVFPEEHCSKYFCFDTAYLFSNQFCLKLLCMVDIKKFIFSLFKENSCKQIYEYFLSFCSGSIVHTQDRKLL